MKNGIVGVTKQLRITQDLVQAYDKSGNEFFGDRILLVTLLKQDIFIFANQGCHGGLSLCKTKLRIGSRAPREKVKAVLESARQ